MKCRICQYDNSPEARFCANCGAALIAEVEPPAKPEPAPAIPVMAVEHMGFWIRFGAAIIDSLILWIVSSVLSFTLFFNRGPYLYPSVTFLWIPLYWLYYWLFTGLKGQTPGKMAVGIKVVNAQGNRPGLGLAALREILGKSLSTIAFFIGLLWIAWDRNKQGWHDRIADTYVVKVVKTKAKE